MKKFKELSLKELDLLTNEEVIEYHNENAKQRIKQHEEWNKRMIEYGEEMFKEFLKLDSNYKLIYVPNTIGVDVLDKNYNIIDEVTKDLMLPQIELNNYHVNISAHRQKWQLTLSGPNISIEDRMEHYTSALVIHNKIRESLAKNN